MVRPTFGIRLPDSGPLASLPNLVTAARAAEERDFDSVWVHDRVIWGLEEHFSNISSGSAEALAQGQDPLFFESLTSLSYLAGIVQKVRLGVAVLIPPPRNPLVLAKQIAMVDVLSSGRLTLGIGVGLQSTSAKAFAQYGTPFEKRGEIVNEYLEAMNTIWSEPLATYHGKYVHFDDVSIYPKPSQKPRPLTLIGGASKAATTRAAKLGDGWIPGYLNPKEIEAGVKNLEEVAHTVGRHESSFQIVVNTFASIDESSQAAWKNAELTVAKKLDAFQRKELFDETGSRFLIGSPSEMRKKIDAFLSAGVTQFELLFIYSSMNRLVEMLDTFEKTILTSYR